MKLRLLFIACAFFLAGCSAAGTSTYLANKPILFIPEKNTTSPQFQEKANRIFVKTLSQLHWQIRSIDDAQNKVVAEACRRGMHCAEIEATVLADGSVSVIRTPGQHLTLNEGNMLKRWIVKLQREYLKNIRYVR